jgi:Family of unknown function (DUF6155)
MAQKSKLPQFKKLIEEMNEKALREELIKLYNKFSIVKDFYNQDLMTEDERQVVLKSYKDKIYKQYWTSSGNPRERTDYAKIKALLAEFEKIAVFPYDVIDLLLFRVETTTDWASDFGGTVDADYNASITAFKKAMKLIKENVLQAYFQDRCETIFKADNIDYWYIDELKDLYNEA